MWCSPSPQTQYKTVRYGKSKIPLPSETTVLYVSRDRTRRCYLGNRLLYSMTRLLTLSPAGMHKTQRHLCTTRLHYSVTAVQTVKRLAAFYVTFSQHRPVGSYAESIWRFCLILDDISQIFYSLHVFRFKFWMKVYVSVRATYYANLLLLVVLIIYGEEWMLRSTSF